MGTQKSKDNLTVVKKFIYCPLRLELINVVFVRVRIISIHVYFPAKYDMKSIIRQSEFIGIPGWL